MQTPLFKEISELGTEQSNPRTHTIDSASTLEILELINDEDAHVAKAVRAEIHAIAEAVDAIEHRFRQGGRLFYIGAGTSGRLGILDASECPPTFGVEPTRVQGIIAGGPAAVFRSQEGAEDSVESGKAALSEYDVQTTDVVCGLAASGRTPFVRGALTEARSRGIYTILVCTNDREQIASLGMKADCIIAPMVGPEVLAGSTRMKSGTAQKMILNMLSTATMIRLGKSYGNIMVDVQPSNAKLRERAYKIIMTITEVDYATAVQTLEAANGNVKTALVMLLRNCSAEEANLRLEKSHGFIRRALQD